MASYLFVELHSEEVGKVWFNAFSCELKVRITNHESRDLLGELQRIDRGACGVLHLTRMSPGFSRYEATHAYKLTYIHLICPAVSYRGDFDWFVVNKPNSCFSPATPTLFPERPKLERLA